MTLAGVTYAAAFVNVVHSLCRLLRSEGLLPEVPIIDPVDSLPPSMLSSPFAWLPALFMDDVLVLVVSSSAVSATSDVVSVFRCAHSVFAAVSLPINFELGKTESILFLNGPSCRRVRRCLAECGNELPIDVMCPHVLVS
jgi:hypothetical protein